MTFIIPAILALAITTTGITGTTGAAAQAPQSFLEPQRTEIATAGYPARGPLMAPVTIVEFSDFECPFCGGLFPTLKAVEKTYYRHSGYPGGMHETTYREMMTKHPERAMTLAVTGMLPHTRLGRTQATHLRVYAGAEHPHQAQQPQTHTPGK